MSAQSFYFSPKKRFTNRPYTVVVEGNIGSGKTTFLNYFNQFNNVSILTEPVNKWRDCSGHNLLDKMYSNPNEWSFAFQTYVQLTMLENHTLKTNCPVKLMERSVYSARNCFVEQMSRNGCLKPPCVAVIDEWFKWAQKNCDLSVDLIVYLRTTPQVAYERVKKRCRPEEKPVSFDYLSDLHEIHEKWLFHKTEFYCPAPVLVIDANLDESVIHHEYQKCQESIFTKKAIPVLA